jgi:AraC-like DNA-binding protein
MLIGLDRGARLADHAFGWGQLVYAGLGVARVETQAAQWTLPAAHALWVPPGVRHRLRCTTRIELQTLYFPPDALPVIAEQCTVLRVDALLSELILRVARQPVFDDRPARARNLLAVLHDELAHAERKPLCLPRPTEPSARRLADSIVDDPSADLSTLCRRAGASRRTLERRFLAESGASLGAFRRMARLHHAIALLGDGQPVHLVAERTGFSSPSAFVASFRSTFGTTPARYFQRNAGMGAP